jgi:alkylation response protein AidB-like acyl-CoA dehydrogenase
MLVPEEHGGGSVSGEGLRDLVLVAEEMGRLVSPGPLVPVNVVAGALAASGTPSQRQGPLAGLLSGDTVAAWCFAERDRPWQADGLAVEAGHRGDGYVLRGVKVPVEAAAEADHLLVTAKSPEGVSQFLVAASTPGVQVVPLHSLDFTRRFASVRLDDVEVPSSALVGVAGGAGADVERQLLTAVVIQCAETCGAAERVFEFTLQYLFDRYSFGRPLASYQALKHRFADMKMWIESAMAATTTATRALAAARPDAADKVSVAKAYVGDRCPELIQDCVQLHGGIGVTWEHDIHLYLRRATVNRETYGDPTEHRERVAALLGA